MGAASRAGRRASHLLLGLGLATLGMSVAAQTAATVERPASAGLCVTCHGNQGIAATPETPHLAGQPTNYLVAQTRAYRAGTRRHEVMNVVAKPLTDAEIDALAAWFASFQLQIKTP
jgi:cytochrome c553